VLEALARDRGIAWRRMSTGATWRRGACRSGTWWGSIFASAIVCFTAAGERAVPLPGDPARQEGL